MIGSSPAIAELLSKLPAVVRAQRTTLITGPTGSGKEVLARMLHQKAFDDCAPFIPVNCGAIPEDLIESELFGHAKGAFTGAVSRKGLVSAANRGILFLDEINSSNLSLQSKLLRFLESKEYRPVGSDKIEKANVWVIAATNKDLEDEVMNGRFREDLLYRLNIVNLDIPALCHRKSDIKLLTRHFLKILSASEYSVTDEAMTKLCDYHWPGNVRELKHCIEQAVIFAKDNTIDAVDISLNKKKTSYNQETSEKDTIVDLWKLVDQKGLSLGEAMAYCEQKLISAALKAENNNRSRAAQRLGIHNRTIFKKITSLRPLDKNAL